MWEISAVKGRGKEAFKKSYWKSVIAAILLYILLALTGTAASSNVRDASAEATQQQAAAEAEITAALGSLSQSEINALATAIFGGVAVIMIVSFLLRIFLFNPLQVGCYRFFRKNVLDPEGTRLDVIKEGFGGYGKIFVTLLLRDIFLCLWSMLFIIPGIVKSYSYRMVPYILKDNPDLSATEAITRSREMMNGNKGRAFLMDLSFLGWFLLGAVTMGLVNYFWTNPYYENTKAVLYLELSQKK